jgi:hypothetical protein
VRTSTGAFNLLAAAALAGACSTPATAQVTPLDHLPAIKSDYFRLQSSSVGRPYHIFVRLPDSDAKKPSRTYPMVYLLDRDSVFPLLPPITSCSRSTTGCPRR